jgi:undecaprenyl diphosphate synthase
MKSNDSTLEELRARVDMNSLPKHVAIIMDGNGRWALRRGLPRVAGHKKGVDTVRRVTEKCRRLGISALTLYAFSDENWGRPKQEVVFSWTCSEPFSRLRSRP